MANFELLFLLCVTNSVFSNHVAPSCLFNYGSVMSTYDPCFSLSTEFMLQVAALLNWPLSGVCLLQ